MKLSRSAWPPSPVGSGAAGRNRSGTRGRECQAAARTKSAIRTSRSEGNRTPAGRASGTRWWRSAGTVAGTSGTEGRPIPSGQSGRSSPCSGWSLSSRWSRSGRSVRSSPWGRHGQFRRRRRGTGAGSRRRLRTAPVRSRPRSGGARAAGRACWRGARGGDRASSRDGGACGATCSNRARSRECTAGSRAPTRRSDPPAQSRRSCSQAPESCRSRLQPRAHSPVRA